MVVWKNSFSEVGSMAERFILICFKIHPYVQVPPIRFFYYREVTGLFGLNDVSIITVYLLCILSTLTCVVYGIFNWNKGSIKEQEQKLIDWSNTEKTIDENL